MEQVKNEIEKLKKQIEKLRNEMPEASWQGVKIRPTTLTFDDRQILAEGEGNLYTIPVEDEPWDTIARYLKKIRVIEHSIINLRREGGLI